MLIAYQRGCARDAAGSASGQRSGRGPWNVLASQIRSAAGEYEQLTITWIGRASGCASSQRLSKGRSCPQSTLLSWRCQGPAAGPPANSLKKASVCGAYQSPATVAQARSAAPAPWTSRPGPPREGSANTRAIQMNANG